jgi:hypothetical protein
MRVLHLLNHVEEVGNGTVNATVDLACLQAKTAHEVGVASAAGQYEGLLARYGVGRFDLDQTRKPVILLKRRGRYRAVVRGFQPDIAHAHMMDRGCYGQEPGVAGWISPSYCGAKLVQAKRNTHVSSPPAMALGLRLLSGR